MFLTNNYRTINNLIIYSKCKYTFRTTDKFYDTSKKKSYTWVRSLQSMWSKALKNKFKRSILDISIKPYGNIKYCVSLKIDSMGKPTLCEYEGT